MAGSEIAHVHGLRHAGGFALGNSIELEAHRRALPAEQAEEAAMPLADDVTTSQTDSTTGVSQ